MASNPALEVRLTEKLRDTANESVRIGYKPPPQRFLNMLAQMGGVNAVRELLPSMSEGFTKLWELKRLDLSAEAIMLGEEWRELFTEAERKIARDRLIAAGYTPPAETVPPPEKDNRAALYRPAVEAILRSATTPITTHQLQERVSKIVPPPETHRRGVESQTTTEGWEHSIDAIVSKFVGVGFWAEGKDVVRIAHGVYLSRVNAAEPFRDDPQRDRKTVSVLDRPGQSAFKSSLLRLYGRCQISECDVVAVLQGCHIKRYAAEVGSDLPDNGLLLRSDIHILFDDDLIAINPETWKVHVAPSLQGTPYKDFAGNKLFLGSKTSTIRPNTEALAARWQAFNRR